jgi:hypothetical protein
MKSKIAALCAFLLLASLPRLPAQTSPSPSPRPSPGEPGNKADESKKAPFIGMTKGQMLTRYGEPTKKSITKEGETWTYSQVKPPRSGVVVFDREGHLKRFDWNTPKE